MGVNSVLYTASSIDHDCIIGEHCYFSPGSTLCGGVHLGEGVFVGCGAKIIQNIHLGGGTLVAAGAVVVKNSAPGSRLMGVPARETPC
jgi:UDP-perosamine 4-acetyltransferase